MTKLSRCLLPLLTLLLSVSFAPPRCLAGNEVAWSQVNIPVEGAAGGWVLANGADTRCLTSGIDGTLYCYATPSATSQTLFKSTDKGRTWATTGNVTQSLVDITTSPYDAASLYFATASNVYRSRDGGQTFTVLPGPGGTGSGNVGITSIDVTRLENNNLVAVSTRDTDAGEFGGVYLLDESKPVGSWIDTSIGNMDVCRVAFSPDYANDRTLVAIATDEAKTVVTSRINDSGWGQIIADSILTGVVPVGASIAFPDGYHLQDEFFIGLNSAANLGDAFKVSSEIVPGNSQVKDLNVAASDGILGVDIFSLDANGNGNSTTILAGCTASSETFISHDGGDNWSVSKKPPTGQSNTCVLLTPDGAYCVTSGTESAFSCAGTDELVWNQISLIDSRVSSINDFAVIASKTDGPVSLFMLTVNLDNSKFSLWRQESDTTFWQRVFSSSYPGISGLQLLEASAPGTDPPVIIVSGLYNGLPSFWKSADSGQNWEKRPSPFNIEAMAVIDSENMFLAGYNGTKGVISIISGGSSFYSEPVAVGSSSMTTIALSPDYKNDKLIFAGNINGQVYRSIDGGKSFETLGQQLPLTTGVGKISLAFDSGFMENHIVYATTDAKATSSSKDRIFSFTVGQSSNWQSIYSALPVDAIINRVAVTETGILYAANSQGVVAANNKGGFLRTLNPSNPSFETMLTGLDETVTLNGIWYYQNTIWAIDTKFNRLMTITDSLVMPVVLQSPADSAASIQTAARLEWHGVSGATEYEWQLNDRNSFVGIPTGFTDRTAETSLSLTTLQPGVKYYWRVRASKPLIGPWSTVSSFTTALGVSGNASSLLLPEAGAETRVNPLFQWSSIEGADSYELVVSRDASFSEIIISRTGEQALPSNAWLCEASLEYNTAYFWKVRGRTTDNFSAWSPVSAFTTEAIIVPTTAPPVMQSQPPTVTPQTVVMLTTSPVEVTVPSITNVDFTIPTWAIVTGLVLLGVIAASIVMLLVVTIRKPRW